MTNDLTRQEIDERRERFCDAMDAASPDWDSAIFVSKVNQYYFTGTMQDGLLLIRKDRTPLFFVRRGYERAVEEGLIDRIYPMNSYRDAAAVAGSELGRVYLETEVVTLGIVERLKKHFQIAGIGALDKQIAAVRAVKSSYELDWMRRAGRVHADLLMNAVPALLREGMSEAEMVGELFSEMMRRGYQGLSRFAMFQTEIVTGQFAFGENSLYPTSFDGPGGMRGVSAATPVAGSHTRKLKKGDLVFVDVAFGINGYHSDKTQVYCFGGSLPDEAVRAHRACMDIQARLADKLRPGAIPADIYKAIYDGLTEDFKRNFMGYGTRTVKFLGHGIGLHVDELPVIADGYILPLKENMTIALEPKKGISGVGLVGVEDTYIVTPDGGCCITGGGHEIIRV